MLWLLHGTIDACMANRIEMGGELGVVGGYMSGEISRS